jgi:hypothetical protein
MRTLLIAKFPREIPSPEWEAQVDAVVSHFNTLRGPSRRRLYKALAVETAEDMLEATIRIPNAWIIFVGSECARALELHELGVVENRIYHLHDDEAEPRQEIHMHLGEVLEGRVPEAELAAKSEYG